MTSWLAAARAVHFGSAMLLFGELAFALALAAPARRGTDLSLSRASRDAHRRLGVVAVWSIAAGIASWLVWLGCEAALMSGAPVATAISADTLSLVLGKTEFGRLWLLRLALAAVLAVLFWANRHSRLDGRRPSLTVASLMIAAAYLATLAWAGHAAAAMGEDRTVQLASDTVHLVAAGAWVGALPGLVALIRRSDLGTAAEATRRFSTLGVASVSALLCTGFVNAWYLVGDVPALIGTDYGRLLLAKLALFAAMLVLAAINRFVLTPRLSPGNPADMARLRRNAFFETAAGAGIVAIVGVLGITIPAAHQSVVWPFSRGLDLEPAYPTSYALPPVRYTTAAIARGAALYAQHCSQCHGALGHGDGPGATALPVRPANLAEHAAFHRPGDLFWFTAHGVPGTPMPGFAATMSDADLWSVVQFLRALSDAESARAMSASKSPPRAIVAPDFTFELPGRAQESLARQRGREMTLLVLYTGPESLPRLRALRSQTRMYSDHGIRVVAVSMEQPPTTASSAAAAEPGDAIRTITATDVPTAYAMFARAPLGGAASGHVEWLIDAQGYLRRRWIGVPAEAVDRTAEILAQVDALAREPPLNAPEERHAH